MALALLRCALPGLVIKQLAEIQQEPINRCERGQNGTMTDLEGYMSHDGFGDPQASQTERGRENEGKEAMGYLLKAMGPWPWDCRP